MCKECGCGDQEDDHKIEEKLDISLTKENDAIAGSIAEILRKKGILSVNIMGAPGSGKTTLIEHVAAILGKDKIAVIQGDLESTIDKERLEAKGIETYQINTHSGCHLDSSMVMEGIAGLDLGAKEFLFIENVGNLVCPAGVKVGQHIDLVVSSTAEGADKPRKYPIIFLNAKYIVISKTDLIPHVDFDEERYIKDVRGISPKAVIIRTEKNDLSGFKDLAHHLIHERQHLIGHHH